MTDFEALGRAVRATLLPGFEGPELPSWLASRLRTGLGGLCLFGSNVVGPEQVRALTDAVRRANPDAVVAIDEEGGDVTRLHYASGAPYPGNAILGRLDRPELTRETGRSVGLALVAAGCTLDFAPDADVNSNPDNPVIGVRSFGADAGLVARHTAGWIEGLQSTGVAACAKHFPGHGDTASDSHLTQPVLDRDPDALRERELVPFRAAIAAGVRAIMTSHILLPRLDPANPATLSRRVLDELLRDELGFDGVIVSDALDMAGASGRIGIPEAAVRALRAGCDLLCIGTGNTDEQLSGIEAAILRAIDDGVLAPERVLEAAERVRGLASAAESGRDASPVPDASRPAGLTVGPEVVASAFEVSPAARRAIGQASALRLVSLDAEASKAIGDAPWGLGAALAATPDADWARALRRYAERSAAEPGAPGEVVLAVGRDNHLHSRTRETVDRLRRDARVVAVDMGWPSEDRAYADIATFGASRLAGEALGRTLAGWIA